MPGLRSSVQEALQAAGLGAELADVDATCDFAELLVGFLRAPAERATWVRVQLARRSELRHEVLELIAEMAVRPGAIEIRDDELLAFKARFGGEATKQLERVRADALSLARFAREQGPEAALDLLDAACMGSVEDRRIQGPALRRLELAAEELSIDPLVLAVLLARHDVSRAAGQLRWPLRGDRVRVGRGAGNDISIPDPQVPMHACTLLRDGARWRVVDAGSGRPTRVDGNPVAAAPLAEGETLQVGPWVLTLSGDQVRGRTQRAWLALSARGLRRSVAGRSLLSGVDLTVFTRELVAVVGPSGAGKSTLMAALTGMTPADEGEVRLGGEDFHRILAMDPTLVGHVPQDDLLHGELRVEEELRYAGRLRHSPEVDDAAVNARADRALRALGLDDIRHARIGDAVRRGISGGQRKRVSLGCELLTDGSRVLLLDEPTSGLDPRSAQDILRRVRNLADDGRMIFLVTHDLSPAIMAQVDQLLVIVPGGRLAFFGPPESACRFFEVRTADRIFDRLGERSPEAWATAFRESSHYRRNVLSRRCLVEGEARPRATHQLIPHDPASWRDQLRALVARYGTGKLRDRAWLGVLFAQPLVLATIIAVVWPEPTPRGLFTVSLASLWFGMSASVRELIADRAIRRREQALGVRLGADLLAKTAVLGGIVATECLAFTVIVYASMDMGSYGYHLAGLGGAQVLTGLTGVCLGLLVSSLSRSSEAAVGALPLLLIPNICFSGIMVSLRDMGWLPKLLTWGTVERYAFDLTLKAGTHLAEVGRVPGDYQRRPLSGPLYELGFKPADVTDVGLSNASLVLALLTFSALFWAAAWAVAWRRER
ncbi:MAG: ATP-binding cassette domain-containing protein [Alphaproteobacteria bacterium]|nr:ATP-binding cassette domain-containing protein [Alphaproteobacteria bacterium]